MKFELIIPDEYVEIAKSWVDWNQERKHTDAEVIQYVIKNSFLTIVFGLDPGKIVVNDL